jgi:chromosome partitioning protein
MTDIIAIVNQKGGVGKTITSINLATALAAIDKKVLIVDSDPQGNATTGFAIDKDNAKASLYSVLIDNADIHSAVTSSGVYNLDILLTTIDLAAAEVEMVNMNNCRYLLKERIRLIQHKYDFIIIDCPPSLGLLTINALTASDSVIIPLQCEFFALEGLKHLLETIKLVRTNLNRELRISGVVLTMYDKRNNLTELIEKDVRQCLGDLVYQTVIPRNVRISEASSHGQPALIYDMHCSGSKAYLDMAKEFLVRENINVSLQ